MMTTAAPATTPHSLRRECSRVPASQAGIFVNLEPLVGAILGVSLLHEVLGITALAGGALIIGGAVYFSYKPEKSAAS
jgi:drug/metabolite transporter (DMT)-like permease